MKKYTIFRSKGYRPTQKVVLIVSLVGTFVLVSFPEVWIYYKIQQGLGIDAAQVTMAFQIILLLALTTVGIGLGCLVDWSIRQRKFIFRLPHKSGVANALLRLWGYELRVDEEVESDNEPVFEPLLSGGEIYNMRNRPKRRGRKPTFPLQDWLPIAAKWENRDPIRDAFTLEDLIREILGENPDGSPIVSTQAYYTTWRERAIEELQRQAKIKNISSQFSQNKITDKGV